ncbi:O-Antigen ligase [Bradyrhizobium erythrophlei]|jgi:O-antigen ligase|nr:O-Antigen ligase [Bradyrhizobium erythrophlei]
MLEAALKSAQKRARVYSLFLSATRSPFWLLCVDIYPVLVAASIPWSTTAVAIFMIVWFFVLIPTVEPHSFLRSLKHPACFLPIAFFALAVIGTLWADGPWSARLHGVSPVAKLLAIPFLFYHFERSTRGVQVLTAFLVSCVLLLAISWIVAFDPRLALRAVPLKDYYGVAAYGVPVKNYIDQSQEFTLCAVALAYPIVSLLRSKRILPAALLIALSLSFVVNMAFVIVSRTALVTMPIMLAVFALLHLKWRSIVIILCVTTVFGGLAWATSPQLRWKAETVLMDYQLYKERNAATSIGLRLEFWQKSLRFFFEAPFLGHGTGSIRGLFEEAAVDQSGAAAQVVGNPHNQTLNVAIQWGAIGIVVLYAMWLQHMLLFRGDGLVTWIGLMVVVQNVFTSLFNSHIFDFHEGWMYVLGVGVAGGLLKHQQRRCCVSVESVGGRNNAPHVAYP